MNKVLSPATMLAGFILNKHSPGLTIWRRRLLFGMSAGLIIGLGANCATSDSSSRAARPGSRLAEYRGLVVEVRKAVSASQAAATSLSSAPDNGLERARKEFNRSLDKLEVVSIRARSRAEAMEKRGSAYFDEWAEEIAASQTGKAREAEQARFTELKQHFDQILGDTQRLRKDFRAYLDNLRKVSAGLSHGATSASMAKLKPVLAELVAGGRQTDQSMAQLLSALNAAEAAVKSGPPPPAPK